MTPKLTHKQRAVTFMKDISFEDDDCFSSIYNGKIEDLEQAFQQVANEALE